MSLGRGTVRTKLEVAGVREHNRKMKSAERALDNLGKGSKGLSDNIRGLDPSVGVSLAAMAALSGVVSGVSRAVQSLTRHFIDLGRRGGSFDAIANRFESMASPDVLQRLNMLTNHQVRQRDIMVSWSQAMEVGLVSGKEYEEWMQRVVRLAQDRDGNPSEWVQRFTGALSGGGLETLRELGVNVGAVRDELRGAGLSMESAEGQSRALDIALEQLRETQGSVSNESSNLADSWGALVAQSENWLDQVGRIVSTNPDLVRGFEAIRQELFGVQGGAQQAGGGIIIFVRTAMQQAAELVGAIATMAARIGQIELNIAQMLVNNPLFNWFLNLTGQQAFAAQAIAGLARMQTQAAALAASAARIRAAFATTSNGGGNTNTGGGPSLQISSGGGGGGGGGGGDGASEADAARELMIQTELGVVLENANASVERRLELEQQIADEWAAQIEALHTLREEERAREEEGKQNHIAFMERMQEASERRQETILGIMSAAAQATQQIGGVFGAVASHIETQMAQQAAVMQQQGVANDAIVKAQEKQAKRVQVLRKIEGSFLVAYNAVMAATEVARAIGSYPDIPAMIAHAASAAAHVTAAVMAGVKLGGGGAGAGASAPVAASFTPREPDKPVGETGGGGVTVIKNFNLARSNAGLGYEMENSRYAAVREGLPMPQTGNIAWGDAA